MGKMNDIFIMDVNVIKVTVPCDIRPASERGGKISWKREPRRVNLKMRRIHLKMMMTLKKT